jgi:NTE family protein
MPRKRPDFDTIALVLQGGGALGAYQAGVMEGLCEAGIEPDWVAGISIGAINAALIAGNAPAQRMDRLREFWETVARPGIFPAAAAWIDEVVGPLGGKAREQWNAWNAWRALSEGQHGFFLPRGLTPWLNLQQETGAVSYYDTSPLRATLERLVDFDRINDGAMRLSVSAVNVATGNFEVFDSHQGPYRHQIGPEHIMASGALPPGFPAVGVAEPLRHDHQGRPIPLAAGAAARPVHHYWDGGLVSNTPLTTVLEDEPRRDTLAFQVDVWSARGELPHTVVDAAERAKDIQFSSRTRAVTQQLADEQRRRRLLRELLAKVPKAVRERDPWCVAAEREACGRVVDVVHLIYQDKHWDGLSKDFEFGALTMRDHWQSGLADLRRTLEHPQWLEKPDTDTGFVTHDVHRPVA